MELSRKKYSDTHITDHDPRNNNIRITWPPASPSSNLWLPHVSSACYKSDAPFHSPHKPTHAVYRPLIRSVLAVRAPLGDLSRGTAGPGWLALRHLLNSKNSTPMAASRGTPMVIMLPQLKCSIGWPWKVVLWDGGWGRKNEKVSGDLLDRSQI